MNRPSTTLCLVVLLGGLCLASCGSGGGNVPGGMTGGGITATFTSTNMNPGANSISMAPGAATDDTFQIVVNVTDIDWFFGAAFRIVFDSSTAEFLSFDSDGSFLHLDRPGATVVSPVVDIRAAIDAADAGAVLVVATLQNSFSYVEGFEIDMTNPTRELIKLTFRATDPTVANAFSFHTASSREVTICEAFIPPGQDCPEIADGALSWNGGTLTAN